MRIAALVLAHIKWFASFDVHTAPKPIGEVLSRTFIQFFIASVAVVVAFFLVDRTIYRRGLLAALDARLKRLDELSILILRLSVAVFLISVWAWYQAYQTSFYVTPELKTSASWVPWFQLALAACALFRRTLPIVGVGLLVLYAIALGNYGVFHLLDYMIFLGLGYFFTVANIKRGKWRQSGFVVLYAATARLRKSIWIDCQYRRSTVLQIRTRQRTIESFNSSIKCSKRRSSSRPRALSALRRSTKTSAPRSTVKSTIWSMNSTT